MSRRKYTAQYKEKAIALSKEKGNVAAAARELGIGKLIISLGRNYKFVFKQTLLYNLMRNTGLKYFLFDYIYSLKFLNDKLYN